MFVVIIVILLIISILNNFWLYSNKIVDESNNQENNMNTIIHTKIPKNINYKTYIVFYNSNNHKMYDTKMDKYVTQLEKHNKVRVFKKNNSHIGINDLNISEINKLL